MCCTDEKDSLGNYFFNMRHVAMLGIFRFKSNLYYVANGYGYDCIVQEEHVSGDLLLDRNELS